MRKPDIVFIIGIGRSGTSLLQNMLNAHSEICFLPENSFLRRYHASGAFADYVSGNCVDVLADELSVDATFSRLGLSVDDIKSLVGDPGAASGDRFFQRVMIDYTSSKGTCRYIGDKDPRLIEFLPMLAASFPGAWVIHIYRDPRDVVLSKIKAEWSKDRPFLANLFAGRVQWSLVRRTGKRLFGDRFHELAYEDLISGPQDVLEHICDLLGLPFEPAMLSPPRGGKVLVADDEMPWKKKSLEPILKHNTGKWRRDLSPYRIVLTEAVCGPMMKDVGYSPAVVGGLVSLPQKIGVALQSRIMIMLDAPYCWYRIWKQPR